MLIENRILNNTNSTSTGPISSHSKAYLYAFLAPAAFAVIFFIGLMIFKFFRDKKKLNEQTKQSNDSKKIESEQELKSNKTSSIIGLIPEDANNSNKIQTANDVLEGSPDKSNIHTKSLARSTMDENSLSKLGKLRQTIYKKKKIDSSLAFSKSSFKLNKTSS